MTKQLLSLLFAGCALAANASTISFQPVSQTIALGTSTVVDVRISGLSTNQALGAFDLFVLNDASILKPTDVLFFSSLGDPGTELTGSTLAAGSAEGAETSFESTATLLALQATQPFSLFELTYEAVGVGTSSLTLGAPLVLADGTGVMLGAPTVVAGSITVTGTMPPPPPPPSQVPEPSSLALLGTGCGSLFVVLRRRFAA